MSTKVPSDFVRFLKSQVRDLQSKYPHANLTDAFTHWACQLIFAELDSDEIFDLVVGIAGNSDNTIDFSYRDDKNGIHYLVQSQYPVEPITFGVDVTKRIFNGYTLFSDNTVNFDIDRLANLSHQLGDSINREFEIRFCFIVFGDFSHDALDDIQGRVTQIPRSTFAIYDLEQLYDLHFSASGVLYETQDIELELPLFFQQSGSIILNNLEPYSVVANVDLVEYVRRVTPFIPRIFDANVRHPLKNKVNREIETTIADPEMRKYFWHYNNGLTILVDDISVSNDRIVVKGPTIVNGCQTTATLSKSFQQLANLADNIKLPLLIRFIKISEITQTEKLRLDIAKYTNSQAPVLTPDFKSNDDEQERVAHLFMMLEPPVFYERKRGQWKSLKPNEQKLYNDNVSMVEIAQQWYAFRASPSYAIVSKNGLFEDTGIYKAIFTPPRPAAEYYMSHLLFNQFSDYLLRKKRESEEKTDVDSLFFLDLARARNLVVSHLINLAGELMFQKYGEFSSDQANKVLERVQKGEIASNLEPLLEGVVTTFRMSLTQDQVLLKEWRNPDTIGKLKKLLNQQIAVFAKARINVLDFV
ncbi:MAG: AIPR family protein [Chloroflexi bacterium]|nr:AIPR family protein [Chloroflexota bacterium]